MSVSLPTICRHVITVVVIAVAEVPGEEESGLNARVGRKSEVAVDSMGVGRRKGDGSDAAAVSVGRAGGHAGQDESSSPPPFIRPTHHRDTATRSSPLHWLNPNPNLIISTLSTATATMTMTRDDDAVAEYVQRSKERVTNVKLRITLGTLLEGLLSGRGLSEETKSGTHSDLAPSFLSVLL